MRRKFRQYVTVEYVGEAPPSPLTEWMQAQVQAAARAFSQPAEHTTKPAKKRRKSPPRSLRDPKLDSQYYRASDLAQILNLSEDTIRRMFEDEPDVIVLGDKNPRGKRRRLTLRIPKSVFDRVCKRLAN